MKRSSVFLTGLAVCLLVACQSPANREAGSSDTSVTSTTSSEDYATPSQSEKTQIYQKRAFPTLIRGATLFVEDYVGVLPGKNEDPTATAFTTYVMRASNESAIGGVRGGDGASNEIVIYRPGTLVFNVYANDVVKTFTVQAVESDEFTSLKTALSAYGKNYKAVEYQYDEDGKEVVLSEIYRSKNYLYNATQKGGYLLSALDDNLYTFSLSDVTADDLTVEKQPAGDKAAYNDLTGSLQLLQTNAAWSYSSYFSKMPSLKRFKYLFYANQSTAVRLFYALGLFGSTHRANGITYYPYFIFASMNQGSVELLPVLTNQDGSSITYYYPFRLSLPNAVKVSALDQYVENYEAPEKIDTSAIVSALREMAGTNLNYTISGKHVITGADGTVLKPNSPYLGTSGVFYSWNRKVALVKVNPDLFYDDIFHGSGENTYPGGYWNYGGKTYNYDYVAATNSYVVTGEIIEAGQNSSYPKWYSYGHMQRFVTTLAIQTSWLNSSYPSYDEATNTYTFSPQYSASFSTMTGFVKLGYKQDVTSYTGLFMTLLQETGSMTLHIDYNEDKTVKDMIVVLSMQLPKSYFPGVDQDYTWTHTITIDHIGTTDLSEIQAQMKLPE